MGKVFERIDDDLRGFIDAQQMFFVATAPLSGDGLVNLSPKGLDGTFRVLDDETVAYLDLTGSGIETVAHVKENGRITFMFCAFAGKPRILRLYGDGEAYELGTREYDELAPLFPELVGARAIVRAKIHRIADSCGWGVPLYDYRGQRDVLVKALATMPKEKLAQEKARENRESLDGLPGLREEEARA